MKECRFLRDDLHVGRALLSKTTIAGAALTLELTTAFVERTGVATLAAHVTSALERAEG